LAFWKNYWLVTFLRKGRTVGFGRAIYGFYVVGGSDAGNEADIAGRALTASAADETEGCKSFF